MIDIYAFLMIRESVDKISRMQSLTLRNERRDLHHSCAFIRVLYYHEPYYVTGLLRLDSNVFLISLTSHLCCFPTKTHFFFKSALWFRCPLFITLSSVQLNLPPSLQSLKGHSRKRDQCLQNLKQDLHLEGFYHDQDY